MIFPYSNCYLISSSTEYKCRQMMEKCKQCIWDTCRFQARRHKKVSKYLIFFICGITLFYIINKVFSTNINNSALLSSTITRFTSNDKAKPGLVPSDSTRVTADVIAKPFLEPNLSVGVTAEAQINLKNQNEDLSYDKWIVAVSASSASVHASALPLIPGWQLLVVGDVISSSKFDSAIILDSRKQQSLGYKILKWLPRGSYAQKSVGYLYAIQHGAKFILDTDLEILLSEGKHLPPFVFDTEISGLVVKAEGLYNPFSHFGLVNVLPRGLPIGVSINKTNTYKLHRKILPGIQQAIIPSLQDSNSDDINGTANDVHCRGLFDTSAPPVIIPARTISPFNSRMTLFHYKTFWSLILPSSQPDEDLDIRRAYWSQPLLWLLNDALMYLIAGKGEKCRLNYYKTTKFFESKSFNDIVQFLLIWQCLSDSLIECIKTLTDEIIKRSFLTRNDGYLVTSWLEDLEDVGYVFQKLNSHRNDESTSSNVTKYLENTSVLFFPQEYKISSRKSLERNLSYVKKNLENFCPNINLKGYDVSSLKMDWFDDILLIVIYNNDVTENLPLVDSNIRLFFKNIVYCAQGTAPETNMKNAHASFIPSTPLKTFLKGRYAYPATAYDCLLIIMNMGYNVNGYLQIHDDLHLNFWHYVGMDKDKIWYRGAAVANAETGLTVWPNGTEMGTGMSKKSYCPDNCPRVMKTYDTLYKEPKNSFGYRCVSNIRNRLHRKYRLNFGNGDTFYLPKRLKDGFLEIIEVFLENQVLVEVVIPTVINCIESPQKHIRPNGRLQKSNSLVVSTGLPRIDNCGEYKCLRDLHYFHAFKLSRIIDGNENSRRLFCEQILPDRILQAIYARKVEK